MGLQERKRLEAINAELAEARKQQHAEKQRQYEEKGMRMQHVEELRLQIAAREEKALQERRDFLEGGNVIRAQIGAERKKLEKIKERKIEELKRAGVPEKYWAELARKKISI